MTGAISNGDRMGVAVVDEDVRVCFTDILEGSISFAVSGSFSTGSAALAAIPKLRQLLSTLRFTCVRGKRALAEPERTNLPLSPRERQVLSEFAQGLLYEEVSHKLGISYSTVHTYQHSIYKKLRVSNRSDAIRIWFAHSRSREV